MAINKISISTITPVYRGGQTLRSLVSELDRVRAKLEAETSPLQLLEAVFVDDGSVDDSIDVLHELEKQFDWVTVIELSTNFGQHPATVAGILHSSGDWVATLDEDLQHRPEELVNLLMHAVGGRLDVVYAQPIHFVHRSLYRDLLSRSYKRVLTFLSGNKHITSFNSFRMIRGSVARSAAAMISHGTYFDVVLCWFTQRIGFVRLSMDDQRYTNEGSGYSLGSLIRHAGRLMITSDLRLLRFGSIVGVLALLSSVALFLVVLTLKLLYPEYAAEARGWTSQFLVTLFFGGLITCLNSIVLEYVSNILRHSQGKPTFLVVDRSKDSLLTETIVK